MSEPIRVGRIGLVLGQIVLAIVILLPFFWMVSVSLKPGTEPFAIPARLWPENPTLENYVTAFRPEFRVYFVNSLVVSLSTVVVTVSMALAAAYTFTRAQTRAGVGDGCRNPPHSSRHGGSDLPSVGEYALT